MDEPRLRIGRQIRANNQSAGRFRDGDLHLARLEQLDVWILRPDRGLERRSMTVASGPEKSDRRGLLEPGGALVHVDKRDQGGTDPGPGARYPGLPGDATAGLTQSRVTGLLSWKNTTRNSRLTLPACSP